jgi:hypothetical protein
MCLVLSTQMLQLPTLCECASLMLCNMALSVWAAVNSEMRRKRRREHESKVLLSDTLHNQGDGHVYARGILQRCRCGRGKACLMT